MLLSPHLSSCLPLTPPLPCKTPGPLPSPPRPHFLILFPQAFPWVHTSKGRLCDSSTSHCRNPCLQLLYGAIMAYGSIVYTLRVLPQFDKLNIFAVTTYILICLNILFFGICSTMDPGVITMANHAACLDEYKRYSDRECSTCNFIKPARSKHCCMYDQGSKSSGLIKLHLQ